MSEDSYAVEFGRRVRSARRAGGLTQDDLAAYLQLSQPTIAKIENGYAQIRLSPDEFKALAFELNVDLAWLLDGKSKSGRRQAPPEPALSLLDDCVEAANALAKKLASAAGAVKVPQRRLNRREGRG